MKIELEKNIDIKEILTSGACFRATIEEDGSITNIMKDRVVNIKQEKNVLTLKSSNYDNLEEIIYEYFDLFIAKYFDNPIIKEFRKNRKRHKVCNGCYRLSDYTNKKNK